MEKVETRSKRRSSEPSGGGVRGLEVRGARGLCRWEPGGETSPSGDTHTNATRRECDDDTLGRCDDEFPQNFRGSRTLTLRSGLRFKSPRLNYWRPTTTAVFHEKRNGSRAGHLER